MRVDIDARVVGRDGHRAGKVGRLVIDPRTNELISLIVHRSKGLLDVRDLVVPLADVAWAAEGEVRLRLSAAELEKLPDFEETDYVPPPPEWFAPAPFPPGGILWPAGFAAVALSETTRRNIPEGTITISEGTPVDCPDGHIGLVDEVVYEPPELRMRGFIVRRGTILTHNIFVPIEWVAEVSPDRVLLNRTKREVEHLDERSAGSS